MNAINENIGTELYNDFKRFNYDWTHLFSEKDSASSSTADTLQQESDDSDTLDKSSFLTVIKAKKPSGTDAEIFHIEILENDYHNTDKRIGIVNIRLTGENLTKSLKGTPETSKKRRRQLFEVLNYAIKKNIEILVFPEASVPFEWLPLLVEQSYKNNIAIIGGTEYYLPRLLSDSIVNDVSSSDQASQNSTYITSVIDNNAYNILFSIFPVKKKKYNTAIPLLRIKNYYSPSEIQLLRGYHFDVPQNTPEYHLYHWRGLYFSVYNCFELSNIADRAIFKSKVDFIVAVEFNRDVSYFSNIAESWARDLHCFIIQSNPSDYGDSRIIQPTKSETKDIIRVKGGDFPLVLVSTLKISELRDFQRMEYCLQTPKSTEPPFYKPSPARYEWEWVEQRIKNSCVTDQPWIEACYQKSNIDSKGSN